MYYLFGLAENLKTIGMLSKPFGDIDTEQNLKTAYLKFLSHIQPTVPHPPEVQPFFVYDIPVIHQLIKNHQQDSFLTDFTTDICLANEDAMHAALAKIQEAIDYIARYNPLLYKLFKVAINNMFYAKSYKQGGGSVSSAIGVIWCSHRKNWSRDDIVEFIVHELTHNLIFLDELRFKHYLSLEKLGEDKNFVISAILKKPRPLDKVFHSLMVAAEILHLRQAWLGEPMDSKVHPSSQEMIVNCQATLMGIKELLVKRELVSDRFKMLVDLIDNKVALCSEYHLPLLGSY